MLVECATHPTPKRFLLFFSAKRFTDPKCPQCRGTGEWTYIRGLNFDSRIDEWDAEIEVTVPCQCVRFVCKECIEKGKHFELYTSIAEH